MNRCEIYLVGVGGQGIGLLSEVLVRAIDYSGATVRGVDTHGLAQRGGMVVSHVRMGGGLCSPMVRAHRADLVLALERHEACRAIADFLRPGGCLAYCDTSWQPLSVRLGSEGAVTVEDVEAACAVQQARLWRIPVGELPDPRMENVALLATVAREKLVPGVDPNHYRKALDDLMSGDLLQWNRDLFERVLAIA